jgi:hypothetical protein
MTGIKCSGPTRPSTHTFNPRLSASLPTDPASAPSGPVTNTRLDSRDLNHRLIPAVYDNDPLRFDEHVTTAYAYDACPGLQASLQRGHAQFRPLVNDGAAFPLIEGVDHQKLKDVLDGKQAAMQTAEPEEAFPALPTKSRRIDRDPRATSMIVAETLAVVRRPDGVQKVAGPYRTAVKDGFPVLSAGSKQKNKAKSAKPAVATIRIVGVPQHKKGRGVEEWAVEDMLSKV